MPTPFSKIYDVFFSKIEEDTSFFQYYDLNTADCMALAEERSRMYLQDAVAKFMLSCSPSFVLEIVDGQESFDVDLTSTECALLGSLMHEFYMQRDIGRLHALSVNFTPSDLKVFSPNEDRKTFMQMYKQIQDENDALLRKYVGRDRITYRRKSIQYSEYADE